MNLGDLEVQNEAKVQAFDRKVIYVYKHIGVTKHEGMLKIGETHASKITGDGLNMRILDQNTAANIEYEVLYTTDAVRNNGTIFSDHDIHQLLEAQDIEREETINPLTNKKSEWFKIDLETVKNLIESYKMLAVEDQEGKVIDFELRDEQKEAVKITAAYYKGCQDTPNQKTSFLWNAKPRFGKTLTAYCFASEIQARKVLIVTNRPAIADSWHHDFYKFDFADEGQEDGKFRWIFTTSEAVKNRLGVPNVYTREDQLLNPNLLTKNTVHFISLQDIKGLNRTDDSNLAQDFKNKNKWLFDLNWDLVIIDESHEGVDTGRAFNVFNNIKTKFTLHLSGTPFKALASNKFSSNQIYNWSYTDEQFAKANWPVEDDTNPYAELPKMNIFTYRLSRALELTAEEAKSEDSEYAFDLSEFFRVVTSNGEDKFVHEDKVKLFIRNLSNPSFQYPFSSEAYRESLRHTFWLLPRVKACEQMKKLLLEDEYFKANYSSKDIIVAAGDGDDDRRARSALAEVRERIGEAGTLRHPLETRTITLSCGQLTTGVTVPAWTAVLMLNNCKSPAQYMQAAFRAQNPFKIATSGHECFMKENCFVFDFAPDRILQTLAELAESINHGETTHTHAEKVKVLINFLPVLAEDDEGKMKYLDANEVLTIPLKLITEEVVSRGFMSNRLFENISNIFGCPDSVKDIIAKMDEARGRDVKKGLDKLPIEPRVRIWQDSDNKVHINEDIVVNTTNGLFGDKKYVEIGSDEGREVQAIVEETIIQARENGYGVESLKAVEKALKKKLPKLVAKIPDPAPLPGEPGYHEKEPADEKPKPKEKSEEEKVRDRLRGFARTIPSFLMAYGTKDTMLATFGDNIPEEVFKELTNITKAEFQKLRDGFDYDAKNEKGELEKRHFSGLFNENVFNSSIRAFEEKQKELSQYYLTSSEEDIFEYIPPQANNQIFTPKYVVRMMVDMLERENPEIFNSTTNTFIDLYMKSGMYITEIVRRIFAKTHSKYPSDIACMKYILEHQVYGFAPTPILDAITKNYIFGFDDEMVIDQKNFVKYDATWSTKAGTLRQAINTIFNSQGGDMKFTAVVGNPPYQGENHQQLYPDFYVGAKEIGENVCLIFPTGWQEPKNANNLSKMNNAEIKEDPEILYIDNRHNIFNGIVGAEWTNIILWQKGYNNGLDGKQRLLTEGKDEVVKKLLYAKDQIVKPKEIVALSEIVRQTPGFKSIELITSPLKPYGIRTDIIKDAAKYGLASLQDDCLKNDDIKVYATKTIKWAPSDYKFPKVTHAMEKYKVFVPYAWGGMDEQNGLGGSYADIIIASPHEVCTETYLESGCFEDKETARKHAKYIMTKFLRALLYKNKFSRHSTTAWGDIPMQDYSEDWWDKSISEIDDELFKKYHVPEPIKQYVYDNIQTRSEVNIINY